MALIRINRNPSAKQLAVFGIAWFVAAGAVGLRLWARDRHGAAEALWVAGAAVPMGGVLDRRLPRLVYLGLSYATFPIGYLVSHAVLAVVFYLVLTPIGLTMRLLGHDPLGRTFDPRRRSYWTTRDNQKPPESYFRQE